MRVTKRPWPASSWGLTGQAPTSVWYSRYSSFASGAATSSSSTRWGAFRDCQRLTASPHRSGISESTLMRARTSSSRLVSWVELADKRVRPARAALAVRGVERLERGPEAVGLAPHLVERSQRVEAVEGRVLDALGHDGPGELLEAQHEVAPLGALPIVQPLGILEQQDRRDEVEQRGARRGVAPLREPDRRDDVRPIVRLEGLVRGADVGAVDGEAGDHLAQAPPAGS